MQKILVSASHYDTLCCEAWKLFEENGYEVIFDPLKAFPAYSTEEIERRCDKEEIVAAVIGMDDYRDEKKYKALPNLKAVAKFGVGVDNIDGELAKKYGVAALNAPGQNSNAVAELTIGFMIDLLRHVVPLHKEMEKGKWPRVIGNEIKGKTVGLLGFGAIAQLVAEKLQCFGVEVLAFDLYPNETRAKALGVKMTTQEEIIRNSDIVSIHIPATPETYHLFNEETISSMKKGFCGLPQVIRSMDETDFSKKIRKAGMEMTDIVPSTMGMLMGTGISYGGKALEGKTELDGAGLAAFLEGFSAGIIKRGKCSRGDRTVLDCIGPAADEAKAVLTENPNASMEEVCQAALKGAKIGVEATKNMVPKYGKAAVHASVSQGVADQGAVAGLVMIQGFADYILN